jgi:hypothetical protein
MPYGFDLFFASNDSDVRATAVAIGPDGVALHPTEPSVGPTPSGPTIVAEGETAGRAWALEYEADREITLGGRGEDIVFDRIGPDRMASLSRSNPVLVGVANLGTSTDPRYLAYGVAHPSVQQLSIALSTGEKITLERSSGDDPSIHVPRDDHEGPGVWWADLPPGPVSAALAAFDEDCTRLTAANLFLQADAIGDVAMLVECPAAS